MSSILYTANMQSVFRKVEMYLNCLFHAAFTCSAFNLNQEARKGNSLVHNFFVNTMLHFYITRFCGYLFQICTFTFCAMLTEDKHVCTSFGVAYFFFTNHKPSAVLWSWVIFQHSHGVRGSFTVTAVVRINL